MISEGSGGSCRPARNPQAVPRQRKCNGICEIVAGVGYQCQRMREEAGQRFAQVFEAETVIAIEMPSRRPVRACEWSCPWPIYSHDTRL